jgi:hypothetical protein
MSQLRGKIVNGQVVINPDRVGRDGRDFPFFKLKMGKLEVVINKEKTLPTLTSLPALPLIPAVSHGPDLEEWRKINIPTWRRILRESQADGDLHRSEYAKWMLEKVLEVEHE